MSKTAAYNSRLSPELKLALAEAARRNRESVAALLERIVREWLMRSPAVPEDEDEQRRLHARAAECVAAFDSGDPDRAANARRLVRERLSRRRGRAA